MKNMIFKFMITFASVACMAVTAHAFDDLKSQQDYLQAVNSEAMRFQPYLVPQDVFVSESHQELKKEMNVEDMLLRLKKLTAHASD